MNDREALILARDAYRALTALREAEQAMLLDKDPERHRARVTTAYLRAIESAAAVDAALDALGIAELSKP